MYQKINKYRDIQIIPNSLIIFDIDETILYFQGINKTWWKNNFDYYYNKYQNYDKAENYALQDWLNHVNKNDPKLIDKKDLLNFFEQAHKLDCEIIFITARNHKLKNITEMHFLNLDISRYIHKIYYNRKKGKLLKELLETKYTNYNNIIFIDDLKSNLDQVLYEIVNKNLYLYLFEVDL